MSLNENSYENRSSQQCVTIIPHPLKIIQNLTQYSHMPISKVSGFWSSIGFKISAVTRFLLFSFLPTGKYVTHAHAAIHKWVKRSYPYVKKSFEAQHGRFPIDSAILAAIGHRFIAKLKVSAIMSRSVEFL